MDTVEELNGTYFYRGFYNLSAGELLFWIFLDETAEQFETGDLLTVGLILLGQPEIATRGKPGEQHREHHHSVHSYVIG